MTALLNRVTIRTKTIASFALVVLLVLTLGLFAINRLAAINDRAADIRDNWLPSTGAQGQLVAAVEDARVGDLRYVAAATAEARQLAAADARKRRANVERLRAAYEPLITPGTDDVRYMREFDAAWAVYLKLTHKFVDDGQGDPRELLSDANRKSFLDAVAAVRNDLQFNVDEGKKAADESAAIYQTTRWTVIMVVAIAVIISLLLAYALTSAVSGPIRRMTQTMTRLAANDLDVAVDGQDRRDEIGAMAAAVQVFKVNMQNARQLDHEQKLAHEQKAKRASQLEGVVANFEVSASEMVGLLSSGSTRLEATAQAMSGSVDSTNRQANAVAAAAGQAGASVQTVAAAAEQLSASIQEISRQVAQSAHMAAQAVSDAQRTNAIVANLADGANKIGNVVGLITSIAGQTNLLALNATIEAARAGDAGKGFAVVASEVKNLASQTGRATQEIGAQITQIQAATTEAVNAIRGISASIDEVSAIATTIAAAVEQQGAATAEIARNVQQTAAATQDVTSNISGVSQAASDSSAAATLVLGAAGDLSKQAARLSSEVNSFVTTVRAA